MPNNKGRNGKGKRKAVPNGRQRNLSPQIVDLTIFNARRKFRFVYTANFPTNGTVVDTAVAVPLSVSQADILPSVRDFLAKFTALKVDSAHVCFDRRIGSQNYRVGAFLLPGGPSNYNAELAEKVAKYIGNGQMQLSPVRRIPLRIGPEFAIGRFFNPQIPQSPAETIILLQDGYESNTFQDSITESAVRIIVQVTTLGPPIDFANIAGLDQTSSPDIEEVESAIDTDSKDEE